jgi:NMD protein affecting ribosome stability and mRNA decay
MRRQWCENMNHRRDDAPVRFCPSCGEVVNANIVVKRCSVEEHAESRMNGYNYCVHCGLQLIK